MASAKATTDHDEIRKWVETRGGHPARVKATGRGKDPGILRIDFPGFSGEDSLEEIEWDEFFEWFDRNNLAMLLSAARGNRFNKLVERTTAKKKSASSKKAPAAKKASSSKKSSGKKASTKKASSTKRSLVASKKSSAKKSSAKKSSAKKSSAKKSTAKKSPAKKTSSKKTSSKKSTAKKSSTTSASSTRTTNHTTIRKWVEARGGFPATVTGTENRGEEAGLLRIDYPGYSGKDTLERIDWDAWFDKFDAEKLSFLYQDKRNSRFSKLVRR